MVFIVVIIGFAFFFYFQHKTSERNMKKFQRSRKKFEELLERLRRKDGETKKELKDDQ
jgi:hypothetical protein